LVRVMLGVASGDLTETELTDWLRRSLLPAGDS